MSYEKQTWNTGDVVTATKLNHIEEGIANAGSSASSKNSQWQGIIIDVMGDSITAGAGLSSGQKKYRELLGEYLGSTMNGYGISGSTISSSQNGMYSRVLNMNKNANLILVFGGTNDYGSSAGQGVKLGEQFVMDGTTRTLNVDVSTFWGALNQMCLNLYATYPNATYVLLTPIHRSKAWGYNGDFIINEHGFYLNEYVDAVKKCGEWFSIPVIDLYATSSLYPEVTTTRASTYFVDGLHPNALGHKVIANVIYEALDKIARKATSL